MASVRRIKGASAKNMITALIAQIVSVITGFVVQKYILVEFGSTINGLTSSITQILSYLTLLETGITGASIQALYKPLAEKDNKAISGVMSATGKQFLRVGTAFFGLLVVLTLLMPLILRNQVSAVIVMSMTFLSGFGSAATYAFASKHQALLQADNKVYVIQSTNIVIAVLSAVAKLVVVLALPFSENNIILIGVVNMLGALAKIIVLNLYVNRFYGDRIDKAAPPNMGAISKRWNVMVHNVAGAIHNHVDVVIISVFSTLSNVSVYNVYKMIYGHINTLIQSLFNKALMGHFGKLFAVDHKKFRRQFDMYEFWYTVGIISVMTSVAVMTLPFVSLYTAGVTDVNYIDQGLLLLFYLSITLSLVRLPAIMAVEISASYKETQNGAILETVINLVVALPAFFFMGIKGLVFGSLCSMVYRSADLIIFAYRNVLKKQLRTAIAVIGVNMLVSAAEVVLLVYVWPITVTGWLGWLGMGVVVTLGNLALSVIVNGAIFKNTIGDTIKMVRGIKAKN